MSASLRQRALGVERAPAVCFPSRVSALVTFVGPVSCHFEAICPLPLRLSGDDGAVEGTTLIVDFAASLPGSLPAALHDVELEVPPDLFDASTRGTPRTYLLNMSGKRYAISATRLMIHKDVSNLFQTVIPPRAVRWRTRLFWNAVFILMRLPLGRALLLRRYHG